MEKVLIGPVTQKRRKESRNKKRKKKIIALMLDNSSGSDREKVEAHGLAHQQGQLGYGKDKMSANDKFGLGYGDHRYDGILSYENEVFTKMLFNEYAIPTCLKLKSNYSQFILWSKKRLKTSESETQTSDFDTCDSDCSVETHESLPEPTVNEPKVVNQPKVWSDAPIIEEYESDSEEETCSLPTEN
ncbi:hypothetical protein Tco_0154454 [Tanacetum coccineum]